MVFPSAHVRRVWPALLLGLVVAIGLTACTVGQAGSATAGSVSAPDSGSASGRTSAPASASASASASAPAPGTMSDRSVPLSAAGDWTSADVQPGPAGIVSPAGDLVATPADGRICFAPILAGEATCVELAPADRPSFGLFSPDGAWLLVLAGPDEHSRAAYVIPVTGGVTHVIGPTGIDDLATTPPPHWDLATAAWTVDSSAVLLAPRTDQLDAALLAADLGSKRIGEVGQLFGEMTNADLRIRASAVGVAMSSDGPSSGQFLWWLGAGTKVLYRLARNESSGGSVYLVAADPRGQSVLSCPRAADGTLGAITVTSVQSPQTVSAELLSDSKSCGGAAFSPDGSQLAVTAMLDGRSSLVVLNVASGRRVLTTALPGAQPAVPASVTWWDDVIVVSDAGGDQVTPSSVIVRLR